MVENFILMMLFEYFGGFSKGKSIPMETLFSLLGGALTHYQKGEIFSRALCLLEDMASSLSSLRERTSVAMGSPKTNF